MINFGEGISLAPINEAFLGHLMEWRNDYAHWKWFRQNDLLDEQSQKNWFERLSVDNTLRMYLVSFADKEGWDRVTGACGLTSINHVNQTAEFSLYIAKHEQGKGYGRAALKTLFNHGFKNLNLNRIWGETFHGNKAALMFEAIGMKREGTLRESYFRAGKFIDSHIYSVLRSEFKHFKDQI